MNHSHDTIAAVSTAPGVGAIAIVRFSGSQSLEIAREIFAQTADHAHTRARQHLKPEDEIQIKSHHATHGFIFDPDTGEVLDEVVLTAYCAPRTYTGDDLIEIACHGSPLIAQSILSLILRRGARLARNGEFTERAFLNGRIDLTQAEAVLDLIQAKTARQGRAAISALTGHLGEQISQVRAELLALLTRIVAGLDFPEEIGDAPEPEVGEVVSRNKSKLAALASTARSGKFLREGLKLAIVGRPNAGKSSLLNQLLKFDRAIVTDIPGTTRDSLEELLDLSGVPVVLIDTAGIRLTEDKVEKIGIERSKRAIAEADLVAFVVDLETGWGDAEAEIEKLLTRDAKPFLLVGNKIDLLNDDLSKWTDIGKEHACDLVGLAAKVAISAQNGQNMAALTSAVESWVFADNARREGPSLNSRQADLCIRAMSALSMVEQTLAAGYPQDCLATDLKTAVDALSEISGESVTEEVITEVFATFCIGK